MYNYVVNAARALTFRGLGNIRVWRKGPAIQFKVESSAPRHIFGSITQVDSYVRFAAWVYEGSSYSPNPFLNKLMEVDKVPYYLKLCANLIEPLP